MKIELANNAAHQLNPRSIVFRAFKLKIDFQILKILGMAVGVLLWLGVLLASYLNDQLFFSELMVVTFIIACIAFLRVLQPGRLPRRTNDL